MALYKYAQCLVPANNNEFDVVHTPGTPTPFSGIYRCEGCGHEVVSEESKPLPPQNHPQHGSHHGAIRWRLIVYAKHNTY